MANVERINSGEVIVEEGSPPSDFFVLNSGSVGVYIDGTLLEVFQAKGTVVGEMSVILGRPRTATVKARSNCEITRYSGDDLLELIKQHPDVGHNILRNLADRLDKANKKIKDLTDEAHKHLWQD